MEDGKPICPRCKSEHIDKLKTQFGLPKNFAMFGDNDYVCRDCSRVFTKEEAQQMLQLRCKECC